MGRGLLLWLIGIPIPIILLILAIRRAAWLRRDFFDDELYARAIPCARIWA